MKSKESENETTPFPYKELHCEGRPNTSIFIELAGILLLLCQWFFPIWSAYYYSSPFSLVFMPVFHLLLYVLCQRLLFFPGETQIKTDELYTWHYYRWWFLNNMWTTNSSYWLKHLLGTSFYNFYLRLCGAKIGSHSHIYTILIDAPWLIEVGESTFIGEEVVLSSLSYQDQTYELHSIKIGSYCTINTRCVLYEGVDIEDHVYVEPMSAVKGHITLSTEQKTIQDRSLSTNQTIYQFICILCLGFIQGIILFLSYFVYDCCLTLLPFSISFSLAWLIWMIISLITVLLLLKFIVGGVASGHYPLNSDYYLRKLWLRQLIITSFYYPLDLIPAYDVLASVILRWLGARIEDDVKFAEFRQILYFPSNLLDLETGVTTFGAAKLDAFEMTKEGLCYIDKIYLGSGTNLGNWCTLMPGTRISSNIMVGSLTLVTRETVCEKVNTILLGIPARKMPFVMADNASAVNDLSSYPNYLSIFSFLTPCFGFFLSKYIIINVYLLLPFYYSPFMHLFLFSTAYHSSVFLRENTKHMNSKVIDIIEELCDTVKNDVFMFIGPFLSGTQFLVYIFRALNAQIGNDVILPNAKCITDPHRVMICHHVRLHAGAYIQVRHYFYCIHHYFLNHFLRVIHSNSVFLNCHLLW
jgi:acetyltransferase-like isoleucine patch superfamily enzyme